MKEILLNIWEASASAVVDPVEQIFKYTFIGYLIAIVVVFLFTIHLMRK